VERPGDYEAFVAIDFILINQIVKGLYDATTIPHHILLSQFVTPETTKLILEEAEKFFSGLPADREQVSLGELQILSTPIVSAVIIDTPSVTLNVQIPFKLEIIELITHITHVDKNVVTFLKGTLSATVRVHTKQREGFFFEIVQEGTSLVRLAIDADSKMQLRTISENSLNLGLSVIIKLFVPFKVLDVEIFKLQDDNSLKLIFTRIQVLTFSIPWIKSIDQDYIVVDKIEDAEGNISQEEVKVKLTSNFHEINAMCENRDDIRQLINVGIRMIKPDALPATPTFPLLNLNGSLKNIPLKNTFQIRSTKKLLDIFLDSLPPKILTAIVQSKTDQKIIIHKLDYSFADNSLQFTFSGETIHIGIETFNFEATQTINIFAEDRHPNVIVIDQKTSVDVSLPGVIALVIKQVISALLIIPLFFKTTREVLDDLPSNEEKIDKKILGYIPSTELLPQIGDLIKMTSDGVIEISADLNFIPDNFNTHVYVQFFQQPLFASTAQPIPIQFAKVTLFDQDAPNPPDDDVIVPKNKEREVTKTDKSITTTTTTFIAPTSDQKLGEATTNVAGIAHFILPPFGNTAGKLRIVTSIVQKQPQGRPPHHPGSDGLPIEVDVNEPEVTETEAFVEESFPDLYFILQSTNQAGNVVRTLDSRHISGPGLLVNQNDGGNRRIGSADKPIKFIFEEAPKTHE
jgi:hypothetical protein